VDDDDFITAAIPSCAVLRESMQSECWTPLVAPWERGKDAAEGSAQANCCDVLYEAALVACPNWPRTPRTPDGGRGIGASEGGDCTQMPHATIAPAAPVACRGATATVAEARAPQFAVPTSAR